MFVFVVVVWRVEGVADVLYGSNSVLTPDALFLLPGRYTCAVGVCVTLLASLVEPKRSLSAMSN